jgi:hypothetical protein
LRSGVRTCPIRRAARWGAALVVNNLDRTPRRVLASTDCIVRFKFIGRPGLKSVEELKGKLDVLQRWNGVSRQHAEVIYDNAAIPRTRYPCYDSIRRTMEVYDSHAMRAYQPEDFYDDSFLKELDASGFIDEVYTAVKARASSR